MDTEDYQIQDHQKWLGYLQPDGLVVSPQVLVDSQVFINRNSAPTQQRFREFADEKGHVSDILPLLTGFLEWPEGLLFGTEKGGHVPEDLKIPLREYGEMLEPTFALHDKDGKSILLVKQAEGDLDKRDGSDWGVSQSQRFERLLRDTQIPIGILANPDCLRLVYAPRGENSGSVTFTVSAMLETAGRPIVAALHELLCNERLFSVPTAVRLPALLAKSREYQARVSEQLAHQVLEALFELVRGFQSADEKSKGELLKEVLGKNPNHIYEGLLNVLMRLVFVLFAEDRALLPTSALYTLNYSVHGLFERLRSDNQTHPDTMDARYGGWSQLLALFRAIYSGCSHPDLRMPARHGYLFDPERFPFLEGKTTADAILPLVSDGTLFRALEKLLILKGERLSYRTLDVEQVGGVYETMMGFRLERATGISVSLKPAKAHGAPTAVNLEALLVIKPADRVKWLAENAETKLTAAAADAVKDAKVLDDMLVALEKRIARGVTPHPVSRGAMILQPSEERRRSGSHYTPRSFTEPIVRKTLEPIFARLGRKPPPEQILALKVCDIAVGSGAFLVETCRQLAEKLVEAWNTHSCMPEVPADEDVVLYARRIVAQRCLYGVDRNPMATDLCKLSLWLATLAKNHPFTFLDHAIRCGDSLVGLTRSQIAGFTWKTDGKPLQRALGEHDLTEMVNAAAAERQKIINAGDSVAPETKAVMLAAADMSLDIVRLAGDLCIAAFFMGDKDKEREANRDNHAEKLSTALKESKVGNMSRLIELQRIVSTVKSDERFFPFHWEVEFPEVFSRENPGFDGIVGNPPFVGAKAISGSHGAGYLEWLSEHFANAKGQVDLVAYFFRTARILARFGGTFGLIGTRTIGKGDTREASLLWLKRNNTLIYSAVRRREWPGEAAVQVSVVHAINDTNFDRLVTLDGVPAKSITAYLFASGPDDPPSKLVRNSGVTFPGFYNYGDGFLFCDNKAACTPIATMLSLIEKDARYRDRIFPFIGGEDFLYSPTLGSNRFVIDFEDFSEDQAAKWPTLLQILREKVYPERQKQNRERRKLYWWQFGEISPGLRQAMQQKQRVLMHPYTTKFSLLGFIPTSTYVASPNYVIALDSWSALAVLQSRIHEFWAFFFGGAREDRLVYTASDCFETFPFPPDWESNGTLEETGRTYYEFRAALLVRTNEGLTDSYNRFHAPEEISAEIYKLRELHAAMDRAVLDAYGWTDIPTDCQFLLDYEDEDEDESGKHSKRKKPWRYRWPDEVRDEVLARLLKLNAERAEEERIQGAATNGNKASSKPKKAKTDSKNQSLLF